MRFAAIEKPHRLASAFDGQVHSIFRRAVNVSLASGDFLTLQAAGYNDSAPGTVALAAPATFDFSRHIKAQARVACRAGVLRIAGSALSVDLRGARQRAPAPIAAMHNLDEARFAAAWRTAWHCLLDGAAAGLIVAIESKRPAGAFEAALARRARHAIPRLLYGTRANDLEAANEAAQRLAGAGPGLTPSGDDFLAGFMVGARRAAQSETQIGFVDALGRRITAAHEGGGDIALAYCRHAANGRAAPPIAGLANAIARGGDDEPIAAAVDAALRLGHSSGFDTALGVLCGLAVWHDGLVGAATAALAARVERS